MTRRRRRLLLLAGAILIVIAATLVRVAWWQPLPVVGDAADDGYFRLNGSMHMHTTLSDGGGSPEELIAEAQAAGVGFIIITDHDNAEAKPLEGYHDDLLVMVGSEVSTRQGHVLGIGIDRPSFCFSGDPLDALDDIRHLGGFAIVAHPVRPDPKDLVNWTAWDLPGSWGMEVVNGHSLWLAASLSRRLLTGILMPVNARYAFLKIAQRPDAVLDKWDELLRQRDVRATLGPDAHSRVTLAGLTLRYPPYGPQLSSARNHLLLDARPTGNASQDIESVLRAIKAGRAYMAMDALAPADGFSFTAQAKGRQVTMGETIPDAPAPILRVGGKMPEGATVRLFRDGELWQESPPPVSLEAAGAGVYRAEVVVPGWAMPWVISNPIYVFGNTAAAKRASRAAWPSAPAPPPIQRMLDDFEGATTFHAEFDDASSMRVPPLDPSGGIGGSAAARMEFRLGKPTPHRPYTWCALVSRAPRDLSGSRGLTFAIRADGVYRLWVQVRDENPRSADEQTEWWFASVRTSTEWKRVTIPYNRFYSLNAETDGQVNLDKVRGLVFVLDHKALTPGTEGTIWIDEVGLFE